MIETSGMHLAESDDNAQQRVIRWLSKQLYQSDRGNAGLAKDIVDLIFSQHTICQQIIAYLHSVPEHLISCNQLQYIT